MVHNFRDEQFAEVLWRIKSVFHECTPISGNQYTRADEHGRINRNRAGVGLSGRRDCTAWQTRVSAIRREIQGTAAVGLRQFEAISGRHCATSLAETWRGIRGIEGI